MDKVIGDAVIAAEEIQQEICLATAGAEVGIGQPHGTMSPVYAGGDLTISSHERILATVCDTLMNCAVPGHEHSGEAGTARVNSAARPGGNNG